MSNSEITEQNFVEVDFYVMGQYRGKRKLVKTA